MVFNTVHDINLVNILFNSVGGSSKYRQVKLTIFFKNLYKGEATTASIQFRYMYVISPALSSPLGDTLMIATRLCTQKKSDVLVAIITRLLLLLCLCMFYLNIICFI